MPFTLTMPKLSPTMEEGSVVQWHLKVGEHIESGDLLLEVSTDKATVEFNAVDSGWLRLVIIPEGGTAVVNQPIAVFTEEANESIDDYKPEGVTPAAAASAPTAPTAPQPAAVAPSVPSPPIREPEFFPPKGRVMASPLAKKLAKEKGIELETIKGTGPRQRIMSRDLAGAPSASASSKQIGAREVSTIQAGTFEEVALDPIRKVIAKRLQESKASIPHFYVQQAVNAVPLDQFREQLRNADVKITFNDCVVRACALALRNHPIVNSGFNNANGTILRFKTVDISVAVSAPSGLITPIVRHADYKSLEEISAEIRALASKAKEGKLQPHEFQGGSFTVSNLGMYGVTDFQAIINPPQAAIIAVSGIHNVPVVNKGEIVPGKIMNVTLSVDHRVIDGVAAAEFLKAVQNYLENPVVLLLH